MDKSFSNKTLRQRILKGEHQRFPYLVVFVVLFFISARNISGQDNTLYLMPDIIQANQLNPAYFKLCRIYVELPVLSSARLNIRNTSFGFHDIASPGTADQSNVFLVDESNLEKKIRRTNYAQVETDINLLGFGFGYKDWYFTFGISNHSDLFAYVPHDVILLTDKNLRTAVNNGSAINLSRTGSEITFWNSIGLSAATELKDGLKIGFRLKYLQGMANAVTRRSELYLNPYRNPDSIAAGMDYRLNSSFPVDLRTSANNIVNGVNFDNSFNNIRGDFIFNGNRGVSIDAGVVFDYDEKTQLSASITDLGFIHWKKNANRFAAAGNYSLNQADIAQLQANTGPLNITQALSDSISRVFNVSSKPYTTLTPVKIFGGATRLLYPGLRAGIMTRIEIYNRHALPSLSLSMNYTPVPWVAASVSYTLMNHKFNQVGAGISLGNRIAQFYIVTDNIVTKFTRDIHTDWFWPYNARMVSLRIGLNLLFGCNKKDNKFRPSSKQDYCPAYN